MFLPLMAFDALRAMSQTAPLRLEKLLSFDVVQARQGRSNMGMTAEDDPGKQARIREVVSQAFSKYPTEVAWRLNGIYAVRLLWLGQTYVGGTSSFDQRSLYFGVGTDAGVNVVWLEHTLHHELAHLLQLTAPHFPRRAWESINDPSFRYASDLQHDGSYKALAGGMSGRSFDPELNRQGLLCQYATSTFEEDWACIAEEIVADEPAFWDVVTRYPRIREKARRVIAFYRKAVPGIRLRDVNEALGHR